MEGLTRDCSESFESDSSSINAPKSPRDYLCFFTKISTDLRAHFSRNSDQEDHCEDIYEDIYSTPVSGSYSYYKDLVNLAEKTENRNDTRSVYPAHPATAFSEFFCSSACSGRFNPNMGAGPFEELFQVLQPTQQPCCLQAQGHANTSTHWSDAMGTISNEIFANSSLEDGYSDFIDIFHRWTSDGFPTEFPPV